MKNFFTIDGPAIDIVIPIYNVKPYLRRCLDSILEQTYQNWRAICVDDGSTDGSSLILDDYARSDSRFLIIRKQNGGLSDARNCGIDASDSDYIMFVDSDDFIHPQTLEIAVGLALRDGTDIVSWYRDANYRNIQLRLCKLFHTDPIKVRPWTMNRNYSLDTVRSHVFDNVLEHCSDWCKASRDYYIKHCYVWRHLIKREYVADVHFTKDIYYEDIPWWSELILKPLSVTVTCLPLYYYYYNPASISRSTGNVTKMTHILTGLIKTHKLYKAKATAGQMAIWSHNIKWAILYGLSAKLKKTISQDDSECLKNIVAEICSSGLLDDPVGKKEIIARNIFNKYGLC